MMADLQRILEFVERAGLEVRREVIAGETFLPGLRISGGVLVVDEARLLYPGDMLHEAGHLAVMTPEERAGCDGDVGADGGMEMAAIAWSYAAALEIGLAPEVVFHGEGYKSGGNAIVENFAAGRYVGVPLLQWFGMTNDPQGAVVFPRMAVWVRGQEAGSRK